MENNSDIISIERSQVSLDELIRKADVFITDNHLHVLRYAIMNKPIIFANKKG